MSMDHKAFVLEYEAFEKELKPLLEAALSDGKCGALRKWIDHNLERLTHPDDEVPLTADWRRVYKPCDPHQYGDIALTRFYNRGADLGLSTDWMEIDDLLLRELGGAVRPTLGDPVGPDGNHFDPGRMGTYFQSPSRITTHLAVIDELISAKPELAEDLQPTRAMLAEAAERNQGLFVTF